LVEFLCKEFEILIGTMPCKNSIVNESRVKTDKAFESLKNPSLDANHMNDRVNHCKIRAYRGINDLMKDRSTKFGTVAVVRVIDRPQLAYGVLVPWSSTVKSLSPVSNGFSFATGAPPACRKCIITVARYHYI
jgi:hypothetical protein